jgi:GDP/UDP-N,N'-diacetylbacillosamine 2-epimerase (hydrolysing)
MRHKRRICFVTGTRAEFGLMESVLRAIDSHPSLELQLVATGMHLNRRHGRTIDSLGRKIHAIVPWRSKTGSPLETVQSTGHAITHLATTFDRLASDIVLIVGDRVEAFAAASAAHISGKIVAHIHGGDRALGQVDDSLRHAITKLAHLHFPATKQSARRIKKLGEDDWRIFTVGAPGIDGISDQLSPSPGGEPACGSGEGRGEGLLARIARFIAPNRNAPHPNPSTSRSPRTVEYRARGQEKTEEKTGTGAVLIVLHPIEPNEKSEYKRAKLILNAVRKIPFDRIVIIHPNNDPGSRGIARCWHEASKDKRVTVHQNIARGDFLRLLHDAAVLVGNSSSGIIEAASFGTPVIDIGPRQLGRERSANVTNVPYRKAPLASALKSIWNNGKPRKLKVRNVYGGDGTGVRIAKVLSSTPLNNKIRRKLIAY